MKTIRICIKVGDPDYCQALSKGLLGDGKFFSIETDDSNEYDLLLTDDRSAPQKGTVFLTGNPALEQLDENLKVFMLYKYQHVGRIGSALRLAHSVFSGFVPMPDRIEKVNVICVCSHEGGAGCTSVSLGICRELAGFEAKRVLYISMEEFPSTSHYFPDAKPGPWNVANLLYAAIHKNKPDSVSPSGYMLCDEYDVFTFRPSPGRNPLRELDRSQFNRFIDIVLNEGTFTDLVFDCGNGLDESIESVLRMADHCCHMIGKTKDPERLGCYLRTTENRTGPLTGLQRLFVKNFEERKETREDELDESEEHGLLAISNSPSCFQVVDERKRFTCANEFGNGIRKVVEHLGLIGR